MKPYANPAGSSGVVAHAIGEQAMRDRFSRSSRIHEYPDRRHESNGPGYAGA